LADGEDGGLGLLGLDLAQHDGDVQAKGAEPVTGGKAIADVIAEEEFEGGAAGGMDFFGLALDDHAGAGWGTAGGDHAAVGFD